MENFAARDKQVFDDMKQCVKDLGLKIMDEHSEEGILSGISVFEYQGYNMGIIFSYDPSHNVAEVLMRYADLPAEKIPALYELLNHINNHLSFNHFFIDPGTRILVLRSGVYVMGYFLNKEMFKMVMTQDLGIGNTFMPLIWKLIFKDQTPQFIMDEFYTAKDKISPEFLGPDGKLRVGKKTEERPFIIEVSATMPAFPTHTHGLTELGMPEFLIDHLCLGANGNGTIINLSYEYFIKAKNANKLDAIKNGQMIRLNFTDLKPEVKMKDILDPDRVYCYRRVSPEFEMVKQAYVIESPEDVDPDMWFVQIYIEGDDFAVTDDYYKGGIKW